jgi:hypothetical protein
MVDGNAQNSRPVLSHAEGKAANGLAYPEGDNPCLARGAYF